MGAVPLQTGGHWGGGVSEFDRRWRCVLVA